jgi:phage tail-like protein
MPDVNNTPPETPPAATPGYPLTKMNFLITVDGCDDIAAFNEMANLDATVDVIEFRQGNAASMAPLKIQGLVKHGNLALKMGYTRNHDIKEWIAACVSERRTDTTASPIRRNVTIELIDIRPGTPNAVYTAESSPSDPVAWLLKKAWVTKYTGPDLNASASEVAIETMELAYEELIIPN